MRALCRLSRSRCARSRSGAVPCACRVVRQISEGEARSAGLRDPRTRTGQLLHVAETLLVGVRLVQILAHRGKIDVATSPPSGCFPKRPFAASEGNRRHR